MEKANSFLKKIRKYNNENIKDKKYTFLSLIISILEYKTKITVNIIRGKILTKEILVK